MTKSKLALGNVPRHHGRQLGQRHHLTLAIPVDSWHDSGSHSTSEPYSMSDRHASEYQANDQRMAVVSTYITGIYNDSQFNFTQICAPAESDLQNPLSVYISC